MCGRFSLTVDIEKIARTFGVEPTLNTVKRYNIAPTQNVVSIVRNGTTHLAELRWGLIPSWAKDESIGSRMINARAGGLGGKPRLEGPGRSAPACSGTPASFSEEKKKEQKTNTPIYISKKRGALLPLGGVGGKTGK